MERVEFKQLVESEVKRATMKHPPMHSLHEGYAVLLEEVDELWDEIKKGSPNKDNLISELVQVAAMCQRIYDDVIAEKVVETSNKNQDLKPLDVYNHYINSFAELFPTEEAGIGLRKILCHLSYDVGNNGWKKFFPLFMLRESERNSLQKFMIIEGNWGRLTDKFITDIKNSVITKI